MSVRSLCTGSRVRRVTLKQGSFGKSPDYEEGDPIECRININATDESSASGLSNATRSARILFADNPHLRTGHYLRWLTNGCEGKDVVLFRVTGVDDSKCRPGDPPWLWIVTCVEDREVSLDVKKLKD